FGPIITFEQAKIAHGRVEMGFDMTQIGLHRFAPRVYRRNIGFSVAQDLLDRVFTETYALTVRDVAWAGAPGDPQLSLVRSHADTEVHAGFGSHQPPAFPPGERRRSAPRIPRERRAGGLREPARQFVPPAVFQHARAGAGGADDAQSGYAEDSLSESAVARNQRPLLL